MIVYLVMKAVSLIVKVHSFSTRGLNWLIRVMKIVQVTGAIIPDVFESHL